MGFNFARNHKGFTLFEIITALVLLGILFIFAFSRMTIRSTDLLTTESTLKAHIRYAQSKAMQSTDIIWGIRFDTNIDSYWMFQCDIDTNCSWNTNMTLPFGAEASDTSFDNSGIQTNRIQTSRVNVNINQIMVGANPQAQLTLTFDDMGVPFWLTNTAITFLDPLEDSGGITRLTQDITIRLTDTPGNSRDIVISNETGFIQ